MKRIVSMLLWVVMGCTMVWAQSSSDKKEYFSNRINDAMADDMVQLREDVAEMMLVGFRGTELNGFHHIVRDIAKYHIGGVILFEYDSGKGSHGRNIVSPKQLKKLCSDLQELSDETLLIGIDQEGGKVCRLKKKAGFRPVISAEAMGRGGMDTVKAYARITGEMLQDMGINLNFAPCVDVNVNPDCPVIGKLGRSFSSDATEVGEFAGAWIKIMREYGVISCVKHFPGHGSSSKDSHHGLVDVTNSWDPMELEPYKMLAPKLDMVMTTHVINGRIDNERPATLSPATMELLRNEIGFNGVVITDDMGMKAITDEYGFEEAIKMALEAGVDMLCLGNNLVEYNDNIVPETMEIILNLVAEGSVSKEQIHTSAERIRTMKKKISNR